MAVLAGLVLLAASFVLGAKETLAPSFRLTNQFGRPTDLETLRGKRVVLSFLYTRCPDTCPRYLSDIATALKSGDGVSEGGETPAVVIVTVDPDRDTVPRLREFSQGWPSDWLFVTGSYQQVSQVWRSYGVTVEKQPAAHLSEVSHSYSVLHTTKAVLINEQGYQAAVLSGPWAPGTLKKGLANMRQGAGTPSAVDPWAVLSGILRGCGEFASRNPVTFLGLAIAGMLSGVVLPGYLLHTFLVSRHRGA